MKKVTLMLFAFLLFSGLTVEAQSNMNKGTMRNMHNQSGMMQGNQMRNYGMMSGGMMGQGMMNGNYGYMMQGTMPMWQYERMVTILPQMQAELSLTSDQTNKLIDLQSAYQKKEIDLKALQQKRQLKLQSLLNDNANSETVRKQLESCSEVRINMGIDAYETVQKMEAVLNDSQKKELQQQMTGTMQNYMYRYMQGYGMGAGMMNN